MFKILGFIHYNLLRYVAKFLKSSLSFRFSNEQSVKYRKFLNVYEKVECLEKIFAAFCSRFCNQLTYDLSIQTIPSAILESDRYLRGN